MTTASSSLPSFNGWLLLSNAVLLTLTGALLLQGYWLECGAIQLTHGPFKPRNTTNVNTNIATTNSTRTNSSITNGFRNSWSLDPADFLHVVGTFQPRQELAQAHQVWRKVHKRFILLPCKIRIMDLSISLHGLHKINCFAGNSSISCHKQLNCSSLAATL